MKTIFICSDNQNYLLTTAKNTELVLSKKIAFEETNFGKSCLTFVENAASEGDDLKRFFRCKEVQQRISESAFNYIKGVSLIMKTPFKVPFDGGRHGAHWITIAPSITYESLHAGIKISVPMKSVYKTLLTPEIP